MSILKGDHKEEMKLKYAAASASKVLTKTTGSRMASSDKLGIYRLSE